MSDEFPFDEGDDVLVRVRESGDTGDIIAKFEAECERFKEGILGTSTKAVLVTEWHDWPFRLANYEAEFEVVGDE